MSTLLYNHVPPPQADNATTLLTMTDVWADGGAMEAQRCRNAAIQLQLTYRFNIAHGAAIPTADGMVVPYAADSPRRAGLWAEPEAAAVAAEGAVLLPFSAAMRARSPPVFPCACPPSLACCFGPMTSSHASPTGLVNVALRLASCRPADDWAHPPLAQPRTRLLAISGEHGGLPKHHATRLARCGGAAPAGRVYARPGRAATAPSLV